jgi:hypothetical protein
MLLIRDRKDPDPRNSIGPAQLRPVLGLALPQSARKHICRTKCPMLHDPETTGSGHRLQVNYVGTLIVLLV